MSSPIDLARIFKNMYSISKASQPGRYFGIEQFKKINEGLVLINKHIDGINSPANIRLFEGPGLGSCLVTDYFSSLRELFEIDNEIITYSDKNDLYEKIVYLQDNPIKTRKIGKKAQEKILKMHTYQHRIEEFKQIITNGI